MFRKIFGLVLLFSFCVAAQANLNSNLVQPAQHIEGTSISYTNGVYTIPNSQWGKAIEMLPDADSGVVYVHLVLDRATTWTKYRIRGGETRLILFDKIRQSGTTIEVDSMYIYTTVN
jgi:hypothetical protein